MKARFMTVSTPGVSPTARDISVRTHNVRSSLGRTNVFGQEHANQDLVTIFQQCRVSDWDGYGAVPVSYETFKLAQSVIESLPLGMPMPSIGAEPDGQITLEWYKSPSRLVSVSVDQHVTLHFAALIDGGTQHGTSVFIREFPKSLRNLIWQVMYD